LAPAVGLVLLTSCGIFGSQPSGEPVTPTGTGQPGTSSTAPSTSSASAPSTSSASPTPRPTGVPGQPTDVVTGLDVPWSVVVLPDGNALISLRDQAKIIRIDPDAATHLVQLLDEGENRVEFPLEMRHLLVRHRDAGEPRDAPNRVLIDRHGLNPRTFLTWSGL